jgi:hypothetical protein
VTDPDALLDDLEAQMAAEDAAMAAEDAAMATEMAAQMAAQDAELAVLREKVDRILLAMAVPGEDEPPSRWPEGYPPPLRHGLYAVPDQEAEG